MCVYMCVLLLILPTPQNVCISGVIEKEGREAMVKQKTSLSPFGFNAPLLRILLICLKNMNYSTINKN